MRAQQFVHLHSSGELPGTNIMGVLPGQMWGSAEDRVLVVGAGPVGLRTAIEAQLLGARTVIVERRPKFTRNNVLKLWKFLLNDLKSLGAKKFYGKFATGSINHINIRTLQVTGGKIIEMKLTN